MLRLPFKFGAPKHVTVVFANKARHEPIQSLYVTTLTSAHLQPIRTQEDS